MEGPGRNAVTVMMMTRRRDDTRDRSAAAALRMARKRASAAEAGSPRPLELKRIRLCGTPGCLLCDRHDGPCSTCHVPEGEKRTARNTNPESDNVRKSTPRPKKMRQPRFGQGDEFPWSRLPWCAVRWHGFEWKHTWVDDDKLEPQPSAMPEKFFPALEAPPPFPPIWASAPTLTVLEARWFGRAQNGTAAARLAALEDAVLGAKGAGGLKARLIAVHGELNKGELW